MNSRFVIFPGGGVKMNKIYIDGFRRITKAEAKRRYIAGETIRIVPVNLRPDNFWGFYADIKNDSPRRFEAFINEYSYYNCIDSETGRYLAFYTREV